MTIIFKDARITQPQDNQPEQIKKIFPDISPVKEGDIVAIKIHPGEYGNTTHVRPVIVRTALYHEWFIFLLARKLSCQCTF